MKETLSFLPLKGYLVGGVFIAHTYAQVREKINNALTTTISPKIQIIFSNMFSLSLLLNFDEVITLVRLYVTLL